MKHSFMLYQGCVFHLVNKMKKVRACCSEKPHVQAVVGRGQLPRKHAVHTLFRRGKPWATLLPAAGGLGERTSDFVSLVLVGLSDN